MTKKKEKTSEEQLVKKYVNQVIANQKSNNMIRGDRLEKYKSKKKSNNTLKMDDDFYFTVVFQSEKQKTAFLNHVKFYEEEVKEVGVKPIRVVNGIELARRMGCDLEMEEPVNEYPLPDLDLMPYVLDNEDYSALEEEAKKYKLNEQES